MHIRNIQVNDLPPLEDVGFDLDPRVNLFIGPNGSGKSTVLRAIKDVNSVNELLTMRAEDGRILGHEFLFSLSGNLVGSVCIRTSHDWLRDPMDSESMPWDTVPILYVPPTRINLPPQDIFNQTIKRTEPYGSGLTWYDIFDRHFGNYVGDFVGEYVEDAYNWLRNAIGANRSHQNQLMKARNLGDSCAKFICDEVIYGNESHDYVEVRDEDDAEEHEDGFYPTGRIIHYGMGIRTKDDITAEPLYAGALSSGTQGTLLWIRALAYKMARHYNWEGRLGKEAGYPAD